MAIILELTGVDNDFDSPGFGQPYPAERFTLDGTDDTAGAVQAAIGALVERMDGDDFTYEAVAITRQRGDDPPEPVGTVARNTFSRVRPDGEGCAHFSVSYPADGYSYERYEYTHTHGAELIQETCGDLIEVPPGLSRDEIADAVTGAARAEGGHRPPGGRPARTSWAFVEHSSGAELFVNTRTEGGVTRLDVSATVHAPTGSTHARDVLTRWRAALGTGLVRQAHGHTVSGA